MSDDPSFEEMARAAFAVGGRIFVPQVIWVKDYIGQVTGGRIGRPSVGFAPLDWLPLKDQEAVRTAMGART